eukprot:1094889-Pelagomonas_calceolata.AAC.5
MECNAARTDHSVPCRPASWYVAPYCAHLHLCMFLADQLLMIGSLIARTCIRAQSEQVLPELPPAHSTIASAEVYLHKDVGAHQTSASS